MTEPADEAEALNALGRRYLDLWLEHWSSCLAAPETAAAVARIFTPSPIVNPGSPLAGFDGMPGWPGARDEPPAFRTAPDASDGRADELEKRIAGLERRLAELESARAPVPVMAGHARKPRGRTRKV